MKVNQQYLNFIAKDQVLVLLHGSQRNNSENSSQNLINFVIKYLKDILKAFDDFKNKQQTKVFKVMSFDM